MNEPLVLEDWELVYLKSAVSDSLKKFYETLEGAKKANFEVDTVEFVIKNYEQLQQKLEAASVDKVEE